MWRGRRLKAPPGRSTRPTSDRVREAVFDVLQGLVVPALDEGAAPSGRLADGAAPSGRLADGAAPSGRLAGHRVLDVFAGSGALGIEALSRGAATATFVDRDRAAVEAVRANLETCDLVERSEVVHADAARFLDRAVAGGRSWTLGLLDPPYGDCDWAALLGRLPTEVAVLEAGREVPAVAGWERLRSKRYGSTFVTIVRKVSRATERR
jgi:16S rRNA (guanine966-N2)-methyltransferase